MGGGGSEGAGGTGGGPAGGEGTGGRGLFFADRVFVSSKIDPELIGRGGATGSTVEMSRGDQS